MDHMNIDTDHITMPDLDRLDNTMADGNLQIAPVEDERCFDIEQIHLEGAIFLREDDQ